ncbi:MAG: hypothetical protein KDE27_00350 [Planctomycetes bacterium]|nr:hypothetical protein [Planctomycetota bacterium]
MIRIVLRVLAGPLCRSRSTVNLWRRLWAWVWFVGGGLWIGTAVATSMKPGHDTSWATSLWPGLVLLSWALVADTSTLPGDTTVEAVLAEQERQRSSLRDRHVTIPQRDQRPWQRVFAWLLLTGAGVAVGVLTKHYVGRVHLDPWRFVGFLAAALPVALWGLERDARSRGEPPIWHRLRARRRRGAHATAVPPANANGE